MWIPVFAGMTKMSMDDTGGRKKAGNGWRMTVYDSRYATDYR